MPRDLHPGERKPSPGMLSALRHAAALELAGRSEAWVAHPREKRSPSRVGRACWRRGWATEYRITPAGQPFYLLNDAGRALVAPQMPAVRRQLASAA